MTVSMRWQWRGCVLWCAMDIKPLTPVERATAVLLTQTLRLLHNEDQRDIAKILNRYGMQPEEALSACRWMLAEAAERAELVMKHYD